MNKTPPRKKGNAKPTTPIKRKKPGCTQVHATQPHSAKTDAQESSARHFLKKEEEGLSAMLDYFLLFWKSSLFSSAVRLS